MNPEILKWAMSQEASPYLQDVGIDPSAMSQFGGSMGGSMDINPYAGYQSELMNWTEANPQNPDLQMSLLGSYFDSMNPMMQQQQQYQQRTDDLNMALALMELGDVDTARQILSGYGFGSQQSQGGLGDYQSQSLQNMYSPMLETASKPEDMQLYNLLASGDPKATSAYYGAKPTFWNYLFSSVPKILGGNVEPSTKARERAVRNAYGL